MALQVPSEPLRLPPEWLAHRYDPQQDAIHFIKADRELRRTVPFLTDENLPSAKEPLVVQRQDSLAATAPPSPIHFIFHSAILFASPPRKLEHSLAPELDQAEGWVAQAAVEPGPTAESRCGCQASQLGRFFNPRRSPQHRQHDRSHQ